MGYTRIQWMPWKRSSHNTGARELRSR